MSTVVIDNMLKGFQDENTDPAKVFCLESDYTVTLLHCLLRFQVVLIHCLDKCAGRNPSFLHFIFDKIMVFIYK